ncbi:MAG: metallophosphoesterase, partial [Armatimonadia bacterium]|nr:metallophosphoesterase [Armatimonadia bacterium]
MDPKYAHKTGAARFRALLTCLLLALPILAYAHIAPGEPEHDPGYHADLADGVVFHDRDGDGKIGPREEGIEGVRVSNGREIVLTDPHGRWELPYDDDTIFFITKPRGWTTPFNEYNIPQFHYIHRPEGSPDLRFGGIEPTGPLPDSINFPLYPSEEPEQFQALFFGDTQPRDVREVEYIRRDVIAELIGAKQYSFGVTLGDIVFDDLRVFQPLKEAIALVGIPWYYVLGNHDINFDAQSDADSDDTFNRHFGPSYYSFDYGPTHFMVLDDVMWH